MENNKHIQIEESGLQCDNSKCDWRDTSIKFEEYQQWLNKPCPKCNENLLTQEDYSNALVLRESFNIINSLSESELLELNKLMSNNEAEIINLFGLDVATEGLDKSAMVHMKISTHNGIKVTEVKTIKSKDNEQD